jgi:hypothetical protein
VTARREYLSKYSLLRLQRGFLQAGQEEELVEL